MKREKSIKKILDLLKRPFAGLPIPLKMLGQEKKGWLSTSGSKLLRDHRSSRNSHFTNKLIENGLVPFAQTNTPEFGFKNITDASFMVRLGIHGILIITLVDQVVEPPVLLLPVLFQ